LKKIFHEKFKTNLEVQGLLLLAITEYERLSERLSKFSSYLKLSYDTQLNDDDLKRRISEMKKRINSIEIKDLDWLETALANMSNETVQAHGLKKYKSFIEDQQRHKSHSLSSEVERAICTQSI
jgi:oligoendopeptidase F